VSTQPRTLVLQTALNPATGVFSAIRQLIVWLQKQPGLTVAAGLFGSKHWSRHYLQNLAELQLPLFFREMGGFRGAYLLLGLSSAMNRWVQQLHDAYKPEHLVIHFHTGITAGLFLPIRARLDCPLSLVVNFHGYFYAPGASRLLDLVRQQNHRWWARRLRRHGAAFICVDRPSIQPSAAYLGLPPREFQAFPNGIEDLGLHGCPRLQQPDRPFTIGFIGNFYENKGWHLAAEAAEQLYRQGKGIRLLMAGGKGPEYARARQWAESRPEFATFLGFVENASVTLIPQFDVLVAPYRVVGAPMVILEALSCGVPVIATAVNAMADMVRPRDNGFLVARDPAPIARCLTELIDNHALHQQMSRRAVEIFRNKFDINKTCVNYLNLYNTLYQRTRK